LRIFVTLEALGGGLQMFFELQKQRNHGWGFDLPWVLRCSLTSLSTLTRTWMWEIFLHGQTL
jgi:hypothetical protein